MLLRPVVERVATISFLCDKPEDITVWKNGWKWKERPNFQELISNLSGKSVQIGKDEFINILHSLVHGGEDSVLFGALEDDLAAYGFSSGKVVNNPQKCNNSAYIATMMLIVLLVRITQVFPPETSV